MIKIIKKTIWLTSTLVCILIALPLFIGWYLSPQDILKKVDVIVVVSGGDNNARIQKGVELYKEGWATKIIYSGAAAQGTVSNARAMRNISVKMGVPEKDILMEESSKTTVENASLTSQIIKDNKFQSIILVTSPYHQRRTFNLFKKELPDLEIINQSARDENWRKRGWWENNVGRFLTVGELGKIFVEYVKDISANSNLGQPK